MVDYNVFDPEGQKIKLFTPGPVYVPDWILKELAKPNDTHRCKPYQELHKSIKLKMQKLLHTKSDILLWTNSATGVMEACVRNLIGPNDKAIFFSCGDFGNRWEKIAKTNDKKCIKVEVPWGSGFTADQVKAELKKDKYSTVFITMNETSTGVMNPLWEIAPVVKEYGALLCVDAVSCIAGVDIDIDKWGIDVVLASVQKCFALPPGLSVCNVSEAAYKKAETVPGRGTYFDFLDMKASGEKNETPSTPVIPILRAMNKMLDYILDVETPQKRYARHDKMSSMVREWAVNKGFEVLTKEGFHSKTVTTIKNNKNINIEEWVKKSVAAGYRFVNGYGSLKDKTFRIGTMGELTPEMVKEFLDVIEKLI